MKLSFTIGFAATAALLLVLLAFLGQAGKLSLILGLAFLLLGTLLTSKGFDIGSSTNAFSAAPIESRGRTIVAAALGAVASIISFPTSVLIFSRLSSTGAWQPIATGLWFLCSGIACGWAYGRTFRQLARRFPALREGERAV